MLRLPRTISDDPGRARVVAVALVVALVLAGSEFAGRAPFQRWAATAAAGGTVRPGRPVATARIDYLYRDNVHRLVVPISAEELRADAALRTDEVLSQRRHLEAAYFAAVVEAQSRAPAVVEVARQLRAVRAEERLDADEYVELIATAVQDIPYATPRVSFQLPAQTLLSGYGNCVDKSVLLAAVLRHEGYDVGVWALPADHHVAAGIRGVTSGFRGSRFAYIETTRRAYVGEVPEEFAHRRGEEPVFAHAGGTRRYRADAQTRLLVEEQRTAERTAFNLAPFRRYATDTSRALAPRNRGEREVYADAGRKQLTASALASILSWSSDDRRVAFASLEELNGWRAPAKE